MIRFLFFLALIIPSKQIFSQSFMEQSAFKSGEKISYNIMYNLGFIWVNAGKVEFSVDSLNYNNNPTYIFKSSGSSYTSYDWVMKVREAFSSYLDCKTVKPLKYARKSIEGSYAATEIYEFDYLNNKLYSQVENSKTKLLKDTITLKQNTFDLLSAIYVCRNLDFSKYAVNTRIPFLIFMDNKYEPLYVRYLGPAVFEDREGKKSNCIKFTASLVSGTIFTSGENMTIWVSNDSFHIPIYIEADILVGSVKAFISSYNGNK